MPRYKVYLKFLYTDTVFVEAENEDEAERKALKEANEVYNCYYDSEISKAEEWET